MSISRSVKIFVISTKSPVRLFPNILISAKYSPLLPSSAPCCHSASIRRTFSISERLIILIQSVRWIDTPRPLVTNPTISSPGTGLQHFEKRTARSWIPLTTIPLFDFPAAITGTLFPSDAMLSRIVVSVTSFFNFLLRSSSILLMTCPSLRAPCPIDARTESQSRYA